MPDKPLDKISSFDIISHLRQQLLIVQSNYSYFKVTNLLFNFATLTNILIELSKLIIVQ